MRVLICALAISVSALGAARAQSPPPIVQQGFEASVADGPVAAVETWFRGSRLEGDAANNRH